MMNDTTEVLLRTLADKLGTTIEHLWFALIKQATISGVASIFAFVVCAAVLVLLHRVVKRKAQECEEGSEILWLAFWLTCAAIGLGFLSELPNIIAAFFNPEYWSLMKIIKW